MMTLSFIAIVLLTTVPLIIYAAKSVIRAQLQRLESLEINSRSFYKLSDELLEAEALPPRARETLGFFAKALKDRNSARKLAVALRDKEIDRKRPPAELVALGRLHPELLRSYTLAILFALLAISYRERVWGYFLRASIVDAMLPLFDTEIERASRIERIAPMLTTA
jgi:hypothetical protein